MSSHLLLVAMHALRDLSVGFPPDELGIPPEYQAMPGETGQERLIALIAQRLYADGYLSPDDIEILGDLAGSLEPLSLEETIHRRRRAALQEFLQNSERPFVDLVRAIGVSSESDKAAQAAIAKYADGSDGDIELDDHVMHSETDDGTWVSAWLYVRNSDVDEGGSSGQT